MGEDVPGPMGNDGQAGGAARQSSATSFIVPSPPTATTVSAPSSAASRAITTASPGAAVSRIPERETAGRQVGANPVDPVHDLGAGDGIVDHVDHSNRL